MVFRLLFFTIGVGRFTIGMGNVCLLFQFLCEQWPEREALFVGGVVCVLTVA